MVLLFSANDKFLLQTVGLDVCVHFFLLPHFIGEMGIGRSTLGIKMFFSCEIVNRESFLTTFWGTEFMPNFRSAF